MGFRIFMTGSGIAEKAQQILINENCTIKVGDPKDSHEDITQKLMKFNPDGIIVRQGKISESVQRAAPNLKVICKHGVGTDNIDIDAATRFGIPVMYTPLANYNSVAEHTFALILSLARNIPIENENIRKGIFDKKSYAGLELLNKTLGIIGYGRIGRRLSELAVSFNMTIIIYDPFYGDTPSTPNTQVTEELEVLLNKSDIVTLHCPLSNDTKGLINSHALAQMKREALLVNTSRGGIIEESDLYDALNKEQIRGAALDVYELEPPAHDNPLFKLNNILFTTHIAGISDNSYINMGLESVKNVLSVLNQTSINMASVLNKSVMDIP